MLIQMTDKSGINEFDKTLVVATFKEFKQSEKIETPGNPEVMSADATALSAEEKY